MKAQLVTTTLPDNKPVETGSEHVAKDEKQPRPLSPITQPCKGNPTVHANIKA